MVKVKMVAGKTYVCPSGFGEDNTVRVGDVREVTEAQAEMLVKEGFLDGLNNWHSYFAYVDGEEPVPAATNTAAPVARVRKPATAK